MTTHTPQHTRSCPAASEASPKLRLLLVSQLFPSQAQPTYAVFNKQQFHALSERFEVKVIVPVSWLQWLRHGRRALRGDNQIEVHYTPYFYLPKVLRRLTPFLMRLSIGPLFVKLLRWQPDAVMASWGYPDAPAVRQLLRNSDLPFFCQVHGSDVNIHCFLPSHRRQIIAAFKTAHTVFAVSASLKSQLISFGVAPKRLAVNYRGVDDTKFYQIDRSAARRALSLPDNKDIFLFVGNLKEPKGPFDLLAAIRHLADKGKLADATLVYIGQGQDQQRLIQLAQELERDYPGCRVMVLGSLPHEQINQWMNAADYLCLPSHNEGVPNVVLESMRCGTPIIASNVGGIPEVLDARCGVLVPAKDIKAIANGIDKARKTQWNRDEIRKVSQKFKWSENTNVVYQIISEAVGERCERGSALPTTTESARLIESARSEKAATGI